MGEVENMTDRELLIQQASDMKNLCRSFDDFKTENRDDHKDMTKEIKSVSDGKISNRLFFFTVAVIISSLIGLTAYVGKIKTEVTKNTVRIEAIK